MGMKNFGGLILVLVVLITLGATITSQEEENCIEVSAEINEHKKAKLQKFKELVEKDIEHKEEIKQEILRKESLVKEMAIAMDNNASDIDTAKMVIKERSDKNSHKKANRGASVNNIFTITAYDLSFQSCGKNMDHPQYGITASGYSLKGMDREEAMTVAADTSVIPMGSKIRIEILDEGYEEFNGVYTVRDRGGAIKGGKIDLFMGDFNKEKSDQSVWDFGRVKARVYLIVNDE